MKVLGCECATYNTDGGRWECTISGSGCMYLIPNAAACARDYGDGPVAECTQWVSGKALTVLQPWAALIECGAKHIETRSWKTDYRGRLGIHAAKSQANWHMNLAWQEPFFSALKPFHVTKFLKDQEVLAIRYSGLGHVIAIATLENCVLMTPEWIKQQATKEQALGDFRPGRYGWILRDVHAIVPVEVKGQQRLRDWQGYIRYSSKFFQ